jgi:hypothetical protein
MYFYQFINIKYSMSDFLAIPFSPIRNTKQQSDQRTNGQKKKKKKKKKKKRKKNAKKMGERIMSSVIY